MLVVAQYFFEMVAGEMKGRESRAVRRYAGLPSVSARVTQLGKFGEDLRVHN